MSIYYQNLRLIYRVHSDLYYYYNLLITWNDSHVESYNRLYIYRSISFNRSFFITLIIYLSRSYWYNFDIHSIYIKFIFQNIAYWLKVEFSKILRKRYNYFQNFDISFYLLGFRANPIKILNFANFKNRVF